MDAQQTPPVDATQAGATRANYYGRPLLKPPDWGWSVIAYLWLGGLGAGAFVVAALAGLRGGKDDRQIARLGYTVATAAMAGSAPLLISHLGRPDRFHYMLRVFKPSSPMNAGAWAISALGAVSLTAACVSGPRSAVLARTGSALVGAPLALFVGTYTGMLLGNSSIPLWAQSPLLPALFACSSLATGAAAVSLFASLFAVGSPRARARVAAAERIAVLAEAASLGAWLAQTGEFAKPLREPPLNALLGKGVLPGLAAPLLLRHTKKPSAWNLLGPLLTLAGGLALRYAIVEGGKASAKDAAAYLRFTAQPPSASID